MDTYKLRIVVRVVQPLIQIKRAIGNVNDVLLTKTNDGCI